MAVSTLELALSSASAASATKDEPIRCCNLSLAATAEAALVVVDAEAFVAFCALLFRLKLFLILLAAVVLAVEEVAVEVDKAALLEEAEEEDVLRIFCDPSKGQDHTQLNAQNIGLGQPVEISLTAPKEVQSSAMRISSKENATLALRLAKQCARTT